MRPTQRKGEGSRWRTVSSQVWSLSLIGFLLLVLDGSVHAFQLYALRSARHQQKQLSCLKAVFDPSDVPTVLNWVSHHTTTPIMDSNSDSILATSDSVFTSLSTMIAYVEEKLPSPIQPWIDRLLSLKPGELEHMSDAERQELYDMVHPNMWRRLYREVEGLPTTWQPPSPNDPLVQAGKSIKPYLDYDTYYHGKIPEHTQSVKDLIPNTSPMIEAEVKAAMDKGWFVLDSSKILRGGEATFPGFETTRSVLAPHVEETVRLDTPANFMGRLKWSSTILPVLDKLPFVAFYYALVEFFFIRPNMDVYKEEVEDDPVGVTTETISDVAVRLGIFFVLAMLTLAFT